MNTTISIIIPTYNYAELLPRAVRSTFNQESVKEIIIINDGSKDDTDEVVSKLMQEDTRIHYIWQQNSGPAVARNKGVREASGNLIMFLDADDELLPNAMKNLLLPFKEDRSIDLVLGRQVSIDIDSGQKKIKQIANLSTDKERNFLSFLKKEIPICHGCFLAKRSLFEKIKYPEHIQGAEDLSVYAHLLLHSKTSFISSEVVQIYHHQDSFRHNIKNAAENGLKIVDAVFDSTMVNEYMVKYKSMFYARSCLSIFRTLYLNGDKQLAKKYYHMAVKNYWPYLFKLGYLRKYLRILFS